ncbi:MAG: nicotinate-nucleotide adenylyltransferase [Betaproteobacteria bacterium]|nr:nicotinate-nucleotide adenylyltransferase [Betaproteobacteria bacterium]
MAAMVAPLGIFGGTFDPIHLGHLELAREVRDALELAAVRLIPAGDPPHRAAPVATAIHRLAMVELAIEDLPGLEVDRREIDRPGRSYTVLTLESLRAEDPARPLALIVGADAFAGFPDWHRWREIFLLAHVVVVARPGIPFPGPLAPALADEWTRRQVDEPQALHDATAGAIFVQSITPHDISASSIRLQLARGTEGIAAVRGLLPPAVLAYIDRNQIYRSRPDAT